MTAPAIRVDTGNGVPPWRQIHDQVSTLIAAGALPPGAQLPTIRQLARDLGLAPGTVARAYRELESAGALLTNRRQGTVVASPPAGTPPRPDPLVEAAMQYAAVARAVGATPEAALAAVRAELAPP